MGKQLILTYLSDLGPCMPRLTDQAPSSMMDDKGRFYKPYQASSLTWGLSVSHARSCMCMGLGAPPVQPPLHEHTGHGPGLFDE